MDSLRANVYPDYWCLGKPYVVLTAMVTAGRPVTRSCILYPKSDYLFLLNVGNLMLYPSLHHRRWASVLVGSCCWLLALSFVITLPVQGQSTKSGDWTLVDIPQAWRKVPTGELAPIRGYSWYRCLVRLPESWRGQGVVLHVEALDDVRAAYVNGVQVGVTGSFPPRYRSGLGEPGRYPIPADLLRIWFG